MTPQDIIRYLQERRKPCTARRIAIAFDRANEVQRIAHTLTTMRSTQLVHTVRLPGHKVLAYTA